MVPVSTFLTTAKEENHGRILFVGSEARWVDDFHIQPGGIDLLVQYFRLCLTNRPDEAEYEGESEDEVLVHSFVSFQDKCAECLMMLSSVFTSSAVGIISGALTSPALRPMSLAPALIKLTA
jgi:hypothetical protein